MQIKLFSIPVMGGERQTEELNAFLRSRKILQVEQHLISSEAGATWCFAIRYLEGEETGKRGREKVDYRNVLDADTFQKFANLRAIRKKIAMEEGIPAFAIFLDQELADMAKLEEINASTLKSINGIGEKKVEKYGKHFYTPTK